MSRNTFFCTVVLIHTYFQQYNMNNLLLSLLVPSKLQCLHFSSWDTNKEWMVDLPKGEDVRALCLGQGWAAVATSKLMLRLFSIGGVQREVFSLPGPVVCMTGHGEQLLIVYHRGTHSFNFYRSSCYCLNYIISSCIHTWSTCHIKETFQWAVCW